MFQNSFFTIMIADMDRAIAFYTETLGLRLESRYENEWAEVVGAGARIGLHGGGEGNNATRALSLGFGVADLDAAMADLKAQGVEFGRVSEDGPVRIARFSDPDGTPLYLVQELH